MKKTSEEKWNAVTAFIKAKLADDIDLAEWTTEQGDFQANWRTNMEGHRALFVLRHSGIDCQAMIYEPNLMVGLCYDDAKRHHSDAYISCLYCLLGLEAAQMAAKKAELKDLLTSIKFRNEDAQAEISSHVINKWRQEVAEKDAEIKRLRAGIQLEVDWINGPLLDDDTSLGEHIDRLEALLSPAEPENEDQNV